jgi:hypothetical protein
MTNPCELVFGGLRKVEVLHQGSHNTSTHGDEITYASNEVADADALRRLIDDEDVAVMYLE